MGLAVFQQLASCGLMDRAWPEDRVVIGLQVCRWFQNELLPHVHDVLLVWARRRDELACPATHLRQEVSTTLIRTRTNNTKLKWQRYSDWCFRLEELQPGSTAFVQAMADAVQAGFGPRLRSLEIANNGLEGGTASKLFDVLLNCQGLTHLDLSENEIGQDGNDAVGKLAAALCHLTALKHLDLSQNDIAEEGPMWLTQALSNCTTITHLNVGVNAFEESGVVALADVLCNFSQLEYLNLCSNDIGPDGTTALAKVLQTCTQLTHLDLSDNGFEDEGIEVLATVMKANTRLTHLDLTNNFISDDGLEALSHVIVECKNLRLLCLADSDFSGGAAHLLAALEYCPDLQTVDFGSCSMGPAEASSLGASLSHCTNLLHLDLQNNEIGRQGAVGLAAGVRTLSSLVRIKLHGNNIGDAGVSALAPVLQRCSSLRQLDFSYNRLDNAGVLAMAHVLRAAAESMEDWGLADAFCGGRGGAEMLHALQVCARIQSVRLCGCSVPARALATALEGHVRLRHLDLARNDLAREADVRCLAAALAQCPALAFVRVRGAQLDDAGARVLGTQLRGCSQLAYLDVFENALSLEQASALTSMFGSVVFTGKEFRQTGGMERLAS